jgi:integrase
VVDSYVERRTGGRLGRRAKVVSVVKELRLLGACLSFVSAPRFKQKLVDPKLYEPFDVPAVKDAVRDRWLRPHEIDKIFVAAASMRRDNRLSRVERFLRIALETGGREIAICELTWDRVDFDANVLHLHNPDRPVTSKRCASVPISKTLRVVLEQAYAERVSEYVLDNPRTVWGLVQGVIVRAGLSKPRPAAAKDWQALSTGISPHTFRHTAATMMAKRGVPLWVIAKILGNSVKQVEKVYAKWQADEMHHAVNLISEAAE